MSGKQKLAPVFGLVLATFVFAIEKDPKEPPTPPKLALLVGCTEYPNHPALRELYGPKNDVGLWAGLLTDPKGFAFPKENVTRLAGWPDNLADRPTYANIVKGFENLIAKAKPDSQVVIVLCGHGIQVPIPTSQRDPLDPKNPEPDGLDEVFLPADVGDWNAKDGLKGAILDNQIGEWLDKLRGKGAHVLIVFDHCHSGTMTRGGPGVREINRTADPTKLKITPEATAEAVTRVRKAVAEAKKAGRPIPQEGLVKASAKGMRGSLVAFSAAQAFEEAPELPFPEDALLLPENYYGVLSWTMVQTLKSRQSPLSYAELQRLIATQYRASRGAKPPTPSAEGDLGREVLGMNVWPDQAAIFVQKDKKGKITLDVGLLQGVTAGSIVTVHPRPGSSRTAKTVLAHLKVTSARPSISTAVPVAPGKTEGTWEESPKDPAAIEDSCRAEILVRDFGDMRLKLFAKGEVLKLLTDKLDRKVSPLLRVVPEPTADWVLRVVTAEELKQDYGLVGKGKEVLLLQGEGRTATEKDGAGSRLRKIYGRYPLDEKTLVSGLNLDLPKLFKWENLWRVAGGVNNVVGGESYGVQVETLKLKDEDDTTGELLRDGILRDGQEVLWRARNGGPRPLWLTAFYLDANLGIQILFSGGVDGGKTVKLGQATTSAANGSVGPEGIIVFAVPQAAVPVQPRFTMLEQEPLRKAESTSRGPNRKPTTPFDHLLNQAAWSAGSRAANLRVPTTPAIVTQSWVVLPAK